jgi:hypothetical protein
VHHSHRRAQRGGCEPLPHISHLVKTSVPGNAGYRHILALEQDIKSDFQSAECREQVRFHKV